MPPNVSHLASMGAALLITALAQATLAQSEPTAMDFVCDGDFGTQIYIDGMQSDWEAEAPPVTRIQQLIAGEFQYDWTGPNDASFMFWCRYTENGLYFAVVGRDNVIVGPEGREGGDRIEVWLRLHDEVPRNIMFEVPLWPVHEGGTSTVSWAHGDGLSGQLSAARAEVSYREHGYFLEFSVPYVALPGYRESFAPIGFAIVHRDVDRVIPSEREAAVGTAPVVASDPSSLGTLSFTGVERRVGTVRTSVGAREDEAPMLSQFANVGGTPSPELVFVMADQLIITGAGLPGFTWTGTTVSTTDDHVPLALEFHDITQNGYQEIFYRYARDRRILERNLTVRQEFVAVYALEGESLTRLLLQEVANEVASQYRIESEMSFRERGGRTMVRFSRPAAGGLQRSEWIDPDEGETVISYQRMLLPWDGNNRISWDRGGDGYEVVNE